MDLGLGAGMRLSRTLGWTRWLGQSFGSLIAFGQNLGLLLFAFVRFGRGHFAGLHLSLRHGEMAYDKKN